MFRLDYWFKGIPIVFMARRVVVLYTIGINKENGICDTMSQEKELLPKGVGIQ